MGDRLAVWSQARPWAMSTPELVDAVDVVQALVVEANAVLLRLVREVDARGVAKEQGASSTAVWLRDRHRVSVRSAHRLVKTAAALDAAPPVVGEAVAAGAVNRDQADTILRSLGRLPRDVGADIRDRAAAALVGFCGEHDPESLTAARVTGSCTWSRRRSPTTPTGRRWSRRRATAQEKRFFTLSPDPDGVGVRLRGRLTPEGAAVVRAAVGPLTVPTPGDGRSAGQRRADALIDVCRLALRTGTLPRHGGSRPQLVLGVDFDVLTQEIGAGTLDGGERVTPEAARRIGCDAKILPVVFDGPSQPLDLGRTHRLVSGSLRQALIVRDRGCAFPSCDRDARWCDGHHVKHWLVGGPTCLSNTVLLCGFHHGEDPQSQQLDRVHRPRRPTDLHPPDTRRPAATTPTKPIPPTTLTRPRTVCHRDPYTAWGQPDRRGKLRRSALMPSAALRRAAASLVPMMAATSA